MSEFRLAIDYGTSTTVAFLCWPDGRIRPVLFDDSPLLPSAVYLEDDGRPLTGRDAVRSARFDPARYEANPKRRIDDGEVLLGSDVIRVEDLIAATLRRVWQEATRIAGRPPREVTLTHPVEWGETRRRVLVRAADRAGLPPVVLVAEPVAAATYFAAVLGHQVAPDACVVVYDLGAGTFDVSLVCRQGTGFRTLATAGLASLGGLDLDAIVVDLLRSARQPEHGPAWERLGAPTGLTEQRSFRELWDGAREAKEALSRRSSAPVPVPGVPEPQHVTRSELEAAAAPVLAHTVTITMNALRTAGVDRTRIAGLFLVGGSTRVPLVASMLHRAIGIAPTVIEQPELIVAEGALHVSGRPDGPLSSGPEARDSAGPLSEPVSASPFPIGPVSAAPFSTGPVSAAPFSTGPVSAAPFSTGPISGAPSPGLPAPVPPAPARSGSGSAAPPVGSAPPPVGSAPPPVGSGGPRSATPGGPAAAGPVSGGIPSGMPPAEPRPPRSSPRRKILASTATALLALVLLSVFIVWLGRDRSGDGDGPGLLGAGAHQSTSAAEQLVAASPAPSGIASPTSKASATAQLSPGKQTSKASPTPRFTGPITVTISLVQTRITYNGSCPPPGNKPILLYADITVNGPTRVDWYWRKDPGWDTDTPTPLSITFSAAGTKRTDGFFGGWSNSANTTITYWVQLVVVQPNKIESAQVTWSTTCTNAS